MYLPYPPSFPCGPLGPKEKSIKIDYYLIQQQENKGKVANYLNVLNCLKRKEERPGSVQIEFQNNLIQRFHRASGVSSL